jgi:ubiquinone/menaquinone biosynthesis C-methylase UbiE
MKVLTNMFGLPRGLLGRLGGRLMVLEHAKIYSFVVDALAVEPADRIVEVGCGSGAASALVAARTTNGLVVAVDPSPVMFAQSRRRLRATVRAGRAEVVQASAEKLPFDDASFTGAFAIFTLHHWADPKQGLGEILRVLHPGGRLVIAERVNGHGDSNGPVASEDAFAGYVSRLTEIGFSDVVCTEHEVGRRKLTIISARKTT